MNKFIFLFVLFVCGCNAWKLWPTYNVNTRVWKIEVLPDVNDDKKAETPSIGDVKFYIQKQDNIYIQQHLSGENFEFTVNNGFKEVSFNRDMFSTISDQDPLLVFVHLVIKDTSGNVNIEICETKLNIIAEKASVEGIKDTTSTTIIEEKEEEEPTNVPWYYFVGGGLCCMCVIGMLLAGIPNIRNHFKPTIVSGYDFDTGKHVTKSNYRKMKNLQLAEERLNIYK
jgi:hypothetical protein